MLDVAAVSGVGTRVVAPPCFKDQSDTAPLALQEGVDRGDRWKWLRAYELAWCVHQLDIKKRVAGDLHFLPRQSD